MSLLKKIGGAVKTAVNNAADQIQEQRERKQAKRAILDRLELSQIKSLCKEYDGGQPRNYSEDPWTGEKTRRTVTRDHWIEYCMENVLLDQIVAYCDKRRIKVRDLLPASNAPATPTAPSPPAAAPNASAQLSPAPARAPRGPPPSTQALLADIQQNFEPETTRDEAEFETQLTIWLKHRFPGQVERQVGNIQGRVDLVLFGKFAIELKIAQDTQRLRNLIGQIHAYKKVWPNVGVILLDVGMMPLEEIGEFVKDYRDLGVPSIVIDGNLRRRKPREWVLNKR